MKPTLETLMGIGVPEISEEEATRMGANAIPTHFIEFKTRGSGTRTNFGTYLPHYVAGVIKKGENEFILCGDYLKWDEEGKVPVAIANPSTENLVVYEDFRVIEDMRQR